LSAIPAIAATPNPSRFFRSRFGLSSDLHLQPLLSKGVQKRDFIDQIAPWLIWTIFFWMIAIVGSRHGSIGATTTNPRSLTQVQTPQPQPASDCRGETLQENGKKLEKR
jgi:hypothetical protein